MKKLIPILLLAAIVTGFKNDKPAYRIYDQDGKKVKYSKMLKEIADADVVFFGELHNNPICHWLQYEVTSDLYKQNNGDLILGAEMFETDNQLILNEYLLGQISEKSFKKEARLWPNYKTDYQPLVMFAKDSSLKFIATNIPRRYASVVYKKGFDGLETLDPQAKLYIAPLPIEYDTTLECYASMMNMGGMGSGHMSKTLPMAQAIKDATMAYSIAAYAGEGKQFIHYNGAYHSDNFESILWYLEKYKPGLKMVTISSVEQEDIDILEDDAVNRANFIIVIDKII